MLDEILIFSDKENPNIFLFKHYNFEFVIIDVVSFLVDSFIKHKPIFSAECFKLENHPKKSEEKYYQ